MRTYLLTALLIPATCFGGKLGIGINAGYSYNMLRNDGGVTMWQNNKSNIYAPNNLISICPVNFSYNAKRWNTGIFAGYYSKTLRAGIFVNHLLLPAKAINPYYGLHVAANQVRLTNVPIGPYKTNPWGISAGLQVGVQYKLSKSKLLTAELNYGISKLTSDVHISFADKNSGSFGRGIKTNYTYQYVGIMLGIKWLIGKSVDNK